MYVRKKIGRFRRLWHVLLTKVFGIEVYVYGPPRRPLCSSQYENWLEPHWLCPGCLKYKPWDFGCSDDHPDLCDSCWCERVEHMKEKLNA